MTVNRAEVTALIIYHDGSDLKFYVVPVDSPAAKWAAVVNGKYMNHSEFGPKEEKAFDQLSDWLGTKPGKACRQQTPIKGKIVEVYHFGFPE